MITNQAGAYYDSDKDDYVVQVDIAIIWMDINGDGDDDVYLAGFFYCCQNFYCDFF